MSSMMQYGAGAARLKVTRKTQTSILIYRGHGSQTRLLAWSRIDRSIYTRPDILFDKSRYVRRPAIRRLGARPLKFAVGDVRVRQMS